MERWWKIVGLALAASIPFAWLVSRQTRRRWDHEADLRTKQTLTLRTKPDLCPNTNREVQDHAGAQARDRDKPQARDRDEALAHNRDEAQAPDRDEAQPQDREEPQRQDREEAQPLDRGESQPRDRDEAQPQDRDEGKLHREAKESDEAKVNCEAHDRTPASEIARVPSLHNQNDADIGLASMTLYVAFKSGTARGMLKAIEIMTTKFTAATLPLTWTSSSPWIHDGHACLTLWDVFLLSMLPILKRTPKAWVPFCNFFWRRPTANDSTSHMRIRPLTLCSSRAVSLRRPHMVWWEQTGS